ncbi:hypothetical protein, partial [Bradyrhizobium liaoningense]|uniref:hypothetical protein n=1 Tax=Bradyrhizobium liaoningense TaxID=43992 RepID=UPI001AEBF490
MVKAVFISRERSSGFESLLRYQIQRNPLLSTTGRSKFDERDVSSITSATVVNQLSSSFARGPGGSIPSDA